MRPLVRQPHALDALALAALREGALGSPLVSRSPLVGSFRESRGFAAIFTRHGRARLEERMPFLAPFLDLALAPAASLRMRTPLDVLMRRRLPAPTGFYLNLLLLGPGGSVGRHVDATLRTPSGVADAVPRFVTVLYLCSPPDAQGGELRLFDGAKPVASIRPRPGMLVQFRGDLLHEVAPLVSSRPDALRASLVCEQYAFDADALARLPSLRLQSRAGFQAYLEPPSITSRR